MKQPRRPAGTNATSRRGIERFRKHGRTQHPARQTPGALRRAVRRERITALEGAARDRWADAKAAA